MLSVSFAFTASMALGVTFLISSWGKFRDPQGFVLGVLDYQVLPPQLAIPYARLVPLVEAG